MIFSFFSLSYDNVKQISKYNEYFRSSLPFSAAPSFMVIVQLSAFSGQLSERNGGKNRPREKPRTYAFRLQLIAEA